MVADNMCLIKTGPRRLGIAFYQRPLVVTPAPFPELVERFPR